MRNMQSLLALSFLALFYILSTLVPTADAKCCYADAGGDCGDNSAGTPCCGYKKCDGLCCRCTGVQVIREEIDTKWHKTRYVWTSVITAPWSPESGWTTWFCRASHVTSWDLPPKTTDLKRFLPFAAHATVTGSVVHDSTHTGINHGHGNTSYDTDHTHSDYSHGNSLPGTSHHAGHNNSSHSHSHGPSESTHHQLPTVTHSGPSTMATVPAFLNHAERMAELADLTEAQTAFKDASKGAKAGGIDVITYDGYLEYFDIHGLNRETEYGQSVARKFHMHDHNGDGVLTFEETQLLCDTDGCVNA